MLNDFLKFDKNISNDENRFKRINVQKIASLKDLFNSSINEVSFKIKSHEELKEISKILNEDGKTIVNDRILKASKTSRGTKISIEWYGWLMEKELPDCEVTDSIVEKFTD